MVFTISPASTRARSAPSASDTVVMTPDGIDSSSSYPKDIESLTIPG